MRGRVGARWRRAWETGGETSDASRGGDAARDGHAPAGDRVWRCSCSRSSGSCISCCPSSPAWARRCIASRTATAGGSRSGWCSSCCRSPATWCCFARCSWRRVDPPRADRLARELPDHDGGPGRDATVRDRRRGGRGADRVGVAPLGDGGAAGGLSDGRVHGAAVRGLCGRRCWSTASAWGRACFRGAARLRSRSCRRSSRRSCSTVVGAMALLPGDVERRLGRWASGSGASGPLGGHGR